MPAVCCTDRMSETRSIPRRLALLTILSLVVTMFGWGSVGVGGYYPYGTAAAAERQAGAVAVGFGLILAIAALVVVAQHRRGLDPAMAGIVLAVAALPLAIPAMWALGYPLNTPAADSFGCGSAARASVPATAPGTSPAAADSCEDRLALQRAVVVVLALPPLGLLATGFFVSRARS